MDCDWIAPIYAPATIQLVAFSTFPFGKLSCRLPAAMSSGQEAEESPGHGGVHVHQLDREHNRGLFC